VKRRVFQQLSIFFITLFYLSTFLISDACAMSLSLSGRTGAGYQESLTGYGKGSDWLFLLSPSLELDASLRRFALSISSNPEFIYFFNDNYSRLFARTDAKIRFLPVRGLYIDFSDSIENFPISIIVSEEDRRMVYQRNILTAGISFKHFFSRRFELLINTDESRYDFLKKGYLPFYRTFLNTVVNIMLTRKFSISTTLDYRYYDFRDGSSDYRRLTPAIGIILEISRVFATYLKTGYNFSSMKKTHPYYEGMFLFKSGKFDAGLGANYLIEEDMFGKQIKSSSIYLRLNATPLKKTGIVFYSRYFTVDYPGQESRGAYENTLEIKQRFFSKIGIFGRYTLFLERASWDRRFSSVFAGIELNE